MKIRSRIQELEKSYDYKKLRLDVIESLINHRGIECNDNRTDMIRHLLLYDEGKYMRETVVEKYDKTKFMIGIDLGNHELLVKMGKLIASGEAKDTNRYYNNRKFFISNINILENEVD
jgi:hypothetical protein